MRFPRSIPLFACLLCFGLPVAAQSPNGNISGLFLDPSSRVIVGADIVAVNRCDRRQIHHQDQS